ncbi:nucleotide-diphospho-sugar transferase [Mycotypha africana]|uniref:nucleotide-diphospho-sugar transferase n=1 Tax=Mycotypha africana TaxID=64632 RepID=UPI0023004E3E|nr:nucleotide-diphospho-sugar transferase [Mycotypha africana]KAI8984011.1 nucleotide-diphospho-sugar transferase [Mycotypha africana]
MMNAYITKKSWRLLCGVLLMIILVYLLHSSTFTFEKFNSVTSQFTSTTDASVANDLLTSQRSNSPSSQQALEEQLRNQQQQQQAPSPQDSTETSNTNPSLVDNVDLLKGEKKYAYVTFLCDDVMGEATEVLVYSLNKTNTKHDILVLVLDEVTQRLRDRLEFLGAKTISIEQVKYPWDSDKARQKGFNKACRYSKLNLWRLTEYNKVVYLDADTMVANNMDELFEYPQFSATVDIGGVLNTGVFVAEPNMDTYTDLMNTYENAPSYNKGDQGFLNYYFNQSAKPLPGNYNVMIKFTKMSTLASKFIGENTVKVLHYTSETKPWNFHFLHQREWRENYDSYLFGYWTRNLREMRSKLTEGGLYSDDATELTIGTSVIPNSPPSAQNSGEEKPLSFAQVPTPLDLTLPWHNKGRVEEICDRRLKRSYGRRYRNTHQFTVILNFINEQSVNIDHLHDLLRIYAASKRVERIFINGKNIKDQQTGKSIKLTTSYLKKLGLRKPIAAIAQGQYVTANNRYNPIQGLSTSAVFMTEDNVIVSPKDFEFAYSIWEKNQDSIVGFRANSHQRVNPSDGKGGILRNNYEYIDNIAPKTNEYSMIQPNAAFMKTEYLYAYTCNIPEQIHHYIDQHPGCHDMAMNMFASGLTGTPPVLVKPSTPVLEFGAPSVTTISTDKQERTKCLNDLSLFFDGTMPLQSTNEIVYKVSPSLTSSSINENVGWENWTSSVKSVTRQNGSSNSGNFKKRRKHQQNNPLQD